MVLVGVEQQYFCNIPSFHDFINMLAMSVIYAHKLLSVYLLSAFSVVTSCAIVKYYDLFQGTTPKFQHYVGISCR